MFYEGLALAVVAMGIVLLLISLKLLLRGGWIFGWLRGMLGLVLVGAALLFVLAAYDVFSYRQLLAEKSIATLSFERLGSQQYRALLVDGDGRERRFDLQGDQWQLDARIIKWPGIFASWGIKPGYRLDRISGRYYSLEKERSSERTVYALHDSKLGVDVWEWVQSSDELLPFVDAVYGSATFVPMDDGALFEVSLSHSGVIARPLNEKAQAAVARWR